MRPKRRDDWLVVPNLWGAIVGPPGAQKNPAVQEAMAPVFRLVAEYRETYAKEASEFVVDLLVGKARAKAAKEALEKAAKEEKKAEQQAAKKEKKPQQPAAKAAKKSGKSSPASEKAIDEDSLKSLAQEAAFTGENQKPAERRLIVNDTSVEKLGELLAVNTNGLLVQRDELTGLLRTLDQPEHANARAFYLEGWDGRGRYTFDRIGRGTVDVIANTLSLFGTIQPGPLARYIRDTLHNEDGLIARFQILFYPDLPEVWVNVDHYPDKAAKDQARDVFQRLDTFQPQGLEVDEDSGIPYVRFDEQAQDLFDEWREDLENRLRSGSLNPILQDHLAKYRSLMPSLALIFHLIDTVGAGHQGTVPPVSLPSALRAAGWCDLLWEHARRVYQAGLDGSPDGALRLADHLKTDLPNPFRARDVIRKGWAGLTDRQDVDLALGVLEDRGWLLSQEEPAQVEGGRPTERFWIHPDLLQTVPEDTDTPPG
jgi:putative DNA primase/helicase